MDIRQSIFYSLDRILGCFQLDAALFLLAGCNYCCRWRIYHIYIPTSGVAFDAEIFNFIKLVIETALA